MAAPATARSPVPLPAVLESQAFGKVAAKIVLPEVEQLALQVGQICRRCRASGRTRNLPTNNG
jgi:hypothetical protein